jgi:hypothetical protein
MATVFTITEAIKILGQIQEKLGIQLAEVRLLISDKI